MFVDLFKATAAMVLIGGVIEAHASDYSADYYQEYLHGATKSTLLHPACLSAVGQLSAIDQDRIEVMREIAVITSSPDVSTLSQFLDSLQASSQEDVSLFCAFQIGLLYGGYEGLLIATDSLAHEFFASDDK